MYLLWDGTDLPLLVADIEGVMALSSNPDVLRGVIRRAKGAVEPSLAGTDLYQRSLAFFREGGFGFSINTAALAEALSGFAGLLVDDPALSGLVQRGLAALQTLGGIAGRLALTAEGVELESVVAVDPAGGDAALADLLLCRDCAVAAPLMAPQASVSVQAFRLPLRSIFDYLQSWLRELEPIAGEPLDLRQLAQELLGLDLDAALFDWLGEEVYAIGLEPFGSDLRTLLYQPAQAWVIPVTSPEAAQAGLEALGETALPLLEALLEGEADLPRGVLQGASERYLYNDVEIDRHRFSFNIDIGVAYLGNFLVIGAPAKALHALIDTYAGAPSILDNPDFRAAVADHPEGVSAFRYANDREQLASLAELLALFGQPLAFVLTAGIEGVQSFVDGEYGSFVPTGEATPLVVPATMSDRFGSGEPVSAIVYALGGLTPGQAVTVTMRSSEFDTYLYLIDATSGQIIFENDDYPDITTSQITFVPEAGVSYWLKASSFGQYGTGSFTLSVMPATTEPDNLSWYVPYDAGLADVEPLPLALGEQVTGVLSGDTFGVVTVYYELLGFSPGDRVSVTLVGDSGIYLAVGDPDRGVYIATDYDYRPDGSTVQTFTVREGQRYWLELQDFSFESAAAYTLDITVSPAQDVEAVKPPPFADLLHLTEILPQALAIVAEHLSTSDGYSYLDGDTLYSRTLIRVAW
jgi:hypothetical protein